MLMNTEKHLVYLMIGDPFSPISSVARDLTTHLPQQNNKRIAVIENADPSDLSSVSDSISFLLMKGSANPIDWLEGMQQALFKSEVALGRILFVADMLHLSKTPSLMSWARACIHFADVVLLNHLEGISQKWLQEFKEPFEKDCYPCLFIPVKNAQVLNPALVLEPVPRRISQAFDIEHQKEAQLLKRIAGSKSEWIHNPAEGDEWFDEASEDPYFEKLSNGMRAKKIYALP